VGKLNIGKAAGATRITAEHIKEWMKGTYCFINDAEDAPRGFEVDILAHSKGFHILQRYCSAVES
jgi:hypothetical protein